MQMIVGWTSSTILFKDLILDLIPLIFKYITKFLSLFLIFGNWIIPRKIMSITKKKRERIDMEVTEAASGKKMQIKTTVDMGEKWVNLIAEKSQKMTWYIQ